MSFVNVFAGGDVFHLFDEALEPKRHDRGAAFVELNGPRCSNGGADYPLACGLTTHSGPLDLSGRKFYRSVTGIFTLVDRDVVHPHRILFRGWRSVRQPHRIAIELDLAVGRRGCRGGGGGRFVVEAEVRADRHGAVIPPVRHLFGRQRIERLAVRILIINRIVAGLRQRRRNQQRRDQMKVPASTDESATCRRYQSGGGDTGDGTSRFCAVMTSLVSTVPVSPCTLAPSESCQRPAIPNVALNL